MARVTGHGSCNYPSQVQVSGQAVAFLFFSPHDATCEGLAYMWPSMPPLMSP